MITIALGSDVGRGLFSNLDNQENRPPVVYSIDAPQKRETAGRSRAGMLTMHLVFTCWGY